MKAPDVGLERSLGTSHDILSVEFLEQGLFASRSVGLVGVPPNTGTGFLIGEGLMMTNHHVIQDESVAQFATFELNVEANRVGRAKSVETCDLEPDRFFYTDREMDMTIVAVSEFSDGGQPITAFGSLPLIEELHKIRIGDPVNIIQHPGGGPKSVVVHNSHLLALDDSMESDSPFCWYSSDTEPGSSGAPVFNNRWEIIALHHRSVPKLDETGLVVTKTGRKIGPEQADQSSEDVIWIANEGIRTSRLVAAFRDAELPDDEQRAIRDRVLQNWRRRRSLDDRLGQESATPRRSVGSVELETHRLEVSPGRVRVTIEADDASGRPSCF